MFYACVPSEQQLPMPRRARAPCDMPTETVASLSCTCRAGPFCNPICLSTQDSASLAFGYVQVLHHSHAPTAVLSPGHHLIVACLALGGALALGVLQGSSVGSVVQGHHTPMCRLVACHGHAA
jgi:hypothetical protein